MSFMERRIATGNRRIARRVSLLLKQGIGNIGSIGSNTNKIQNTQRHQQRRGNKERRHNSGTQGERKEEEQANVKEVKVDEGGARKGEERTEQEEDEERLPTYNSLPSTPTRERSTNPTMENTTISPLVLFDSPAKPG